MQHRPKELADIVGNVETIERLKVIARDGNCPHIIITVSLITRTLLVQARVGSRSSSSHSPHNPSQGSPGIGKTTSILALARQLLGDNYKEGVLELNASDERYVARIFAPLPPKPVPSRSCIVFETEGSTSCATASRHSRRRR